MLVDRHRKVFLDVLEKHDSKRPLDVFEKRVLAVLLNYPEYHAVVRGQLDIAAMSPNPYAQMGLHYALHDHLRDDIPKGIVGVFHAHTKKIGDSAKAELDMVAVMYELIAQSADKQLSDAAYVEMMQKMLKEI